MQVPATTFSPWRLRRDCIASGHLFPLSPSSLLVRPPPHSSAYQFALHLLSPAAHCARLVAAPLALALPFACCVLRTCAYGMDGLLFWTHLAHWAATAVLMVYHRDSGRADAAVGACVAARALWLSTARVCVTAVLARAGVLRAGQRRGDRGRAALDEVVVTGELDADSRGPPSTCVDKPQQPQGAPGSHKESGTRALTRPSPPNHAVCDGADALALALLWCLAVTAAAVGLRRLVARGALEEWNDGRDSLLWATVAAAVVEAAPGTLFLGCDFFSAFFFFEDLKRTMVAFFQQGCWCSSGITSHPSVGSMAMRCCLPV